MNLILEHKELQGEIRVVMRRAIIYQNPDMSHEDLCKQFDFHHVPMPSEWTINADSNSSWKSAYRNPNFRKLIDPMISKEKTRLRSK